MPVTRRDSIFVIAAADERDMKDIAAAVWKIWKCKEELADVRYTCGIR